MKKIYTLIFISFCTGFVAYGQLKESTAIDKIFTEWNKPNVPGGALGIIRDGKLIYSKGYGIADLEHNISITPTSVFYIGSVSKQFVTFSILLLEEQGKLNLDDKIQEFLPDFPEYKTPLTIRHFIHHTSGIRDFLTLMHLKGRDYLDHIENDEVYELIKSQNTLNFSPGEQYLYSNSCYFMLAMIVEKAAKKSLKDFAEEHIFSPLGMKNSLFYDDNTDLIKNRVFSYNKKEDGFDNLIMRFDLVGSGGIYSTIEDMFLWDQNFYQNKLGKGGQQIIQKMHEEGVLNNGKSSGYAFALKNGTHKGLKTVSHGGSLAGYRAQLMRFPEQKFSIIILSNRSDASPTSKAYQVADIFLKNEFKQNQEINQKSNLSNKKAIKLSTKKLEFFSGSYWNNKNNSAIKIVVKNDTLTYSRNNYSETKLFPISKNEFIAKETSDVILKFKTTNEGKQVLIIINGNSKIKYISYKPASYSLEELKSFIGLYYSPELDVVYNLKMENKNIILYVNRRKTSVLKAIKDNVFSNDNFGVFLFERNNDGKINAFKLMAGRVKNLKFIKQ
ncbi:MAG: beta-lactamase family protein [Methanosarcinales archaeon]|nr:beta-lactamase family protein [Methanosarcinales archaeon]